MQDINYSHVQYSVVNVVAKDRMADDELEEIRKLRFHYEICSRHLNNTTGLALMVCIFTILVVSFCFFLEQFKFWSVMS